MGCQGHGVVRYGDTGVLDLEGWGHREMGPWGVGTGGC